MMSGVCYLFGIIMLIVAIILFLYGFCELIRASHYKDRNALHNSFKILLVSGLILLLSAGSCSLGGKMNTHGYTAPIG